jgi:hypothetical protein
MAITATKTCQDVEASPIVGPFLAGKVQPILREAKNCKVIEAVLDFRYLDTSHPMLQELRQREKLDEVMAPGKTEFEKILLIKRWVGLQWKFGTPVPYPPWNAVIILDWIRSGKTGGFCGQYGMVFVQSLLSLGIQARYVELGQRSNPVCHWSSEVWLNDFNKWAMVDATANQNLSCYYERDGIPQNTLELHFAYFNNEVHTIKRVQDPVVIESVGVKPDPLVLDSFYNFRVCMDQNQLEFPPEVINYDHTTYDRYGTAVEWEDERTVLYDANPCPPSWFIEPQRLTARRANRPEQLYYTMHNGVNMQLRWFDGDTYVLYLKAHFPAFEGFLARFDGGEWQPVRAHHPYEMSPGRHKIEARTKAKDGSLGPISYLDFECPSG